MSDTPLAADPVALQLPFLDRAVGFEHGVEVAEQQQALALLAVAGGKQVAGALHGGRHLDPAGRKAQFVELFTEDLAHFAHAGVVHGAAVDVDAAFEQGQRGRRARPDCGDDALFDRRQLLGVGGAGGQGGQQGKDEGARFHKLGFPIRSGSGGHGQGGAWCGPPSGSTSVKRRRQSTAR
ncbi:hypothetical protein ACFSQU_09680 [Massilia sp. GCM10020059]|uniref:Uncharacterized protein n=1 Tax=Massilia agrisoli TaxID=2892444 RepID=A0ABS8INN3_9BURK|nr:hypothetical protein [Massilia agrisoli]MCC6069526.1 hypothetical protein [Massilia agrisoli]